jgi:hypothetical protein
VFLKRLLPVIIGLISFFIFLPFLNLYFVQDDFFLLSVSRVTTFWDIFRFFIPRPDVVWFRPLSSEVFFFFGRLVFGLHPFYYHIVIFLTHLFNGYLLSVLSGQISGNKNSGRLAAFFYVTNASLAVALGWGATFSFILGVTFILLTLIFLLYAKDNWAVIFHLLGVLSSEVVSLNCLIILILFLVKKKKINPGIIVYFLISVGILIWRYVLYPVQTAGSDYQMFINFGIFSQLRFYFFRFFGLPMLLRNKDPLNFLLLAGFTILLVLIGLAIHKNWRNKSIKRHWVIPLSIIIVYLMPFLILNRHIAPHYLSFSLTGFCIILGIIFSQLELRDKYLIRTFIIIYLLIQIISSKLTYNTHWLVNRAQMAKELIDKKVYSAPVGSEEYFALGAGRAGDVFGIRKQGERIKYDE